MAHFARLINNIVEEVVVVSNDIAVDEESGITFLLQLFGPNKEWVQCSFNNSVRKQYPGVGFSYDPVNDIFIAPCPGTGWELDKNNNWINQNIVV